MTDHVYGTASVAKHTPFDEPAKDEKHAVYFDGGRRSKAPVDALRGMNPVFTSF